MTDPARYHEYTAAHNVGSRALFAFRPREFLTEAVTEPGEEKGLVPALMDRFGALGGVELKFRLVRPGRARLISPR